MKTIIKLTLKSAIRDPYLLFWSLFLPIAGTAGFGYFMENIQYTQRIMTGMMCVSVIFYAYMTTVFTNLAQRRRGVYNLLHITPLSLGKYILSVSIAWTIIASICSYIVLTAGAVLFKIPMTIGTLLGVLPIIFIAALGYIFLSFFISSYCRNEGHASMINNIISLPMLFCSDAFYSLQSAPEIIQKISMINPFQYFVNGVRAAFSVSFSGYISSISVLLLVLIISLILSIKTFRFAE